MPDLARVHESTKGEAALRDRLNPKRMPITWARSRKSIFSSFLRRVEKISRAPMHISYSEVRRPRVTGAFAIPA